MGGLQASQTSSKVGIPFVEDQPEQGLPGVCSLATSLIGWESPLKGGASLGEGPVILVSDCSGYTTISVAGILLYRIYNYLLIYLLIASPVRK